MKIRLTAIGAALVLGVSLQAGTTFDFTTTNQQDATGATQQFTAGTGSSAITATVSAYSASAYSGTGTSSTGALTAASLGTYGSGTGLGVCDGSTINGVVTGEGGPPCGTPYHQVDNNGLVDMVLLSFSTAVNLSSIQLSFWGGSSGSDNLQNISYWTNVTTSVGVSSGSSETTLLCSSTTGKTDSCATNASGGTLSYGASNFGTGAFSGTDVNNILISAQYAANITAANASYFKIENLTVTNYVSPTPEPASFLLIGSGLLAGAFFARRRILAKASN